MEEALRLGDVGVDVGFPWIEAGGARGVSERPGPAPAFLMVLAGGEGRYCIVGKEGRTPRVEGLRVKGSDRPPQARATPQVSNMP